MTPRVRTAQPAIFDTRARTDELLALTAQVAERRLANLLRLGDNASRFFERCRRTHHAILRALRALIARRATRDELLARGALARAFEVAAQRFKIGAVALHFCLETLGRAFP